MTDRPRVPTAKSRRLATAQPEGLASVLASKVVGQPSMIDALVPCVEMFQAGLAPENRPAGVFLLLGPTGTGKTRTVEALAEALHGSAKSLLKIDCGEYQMEHEVAKLIGAPPGYLGHRETQPALTQQKLTAVASEKCGLSLVLFDEIEKAAPSMARLMLGMLDRGILRLGDNSQVSFEKTIVFMTSNLGARDMMREISPEIGFQSAVPMAREEAAGKLRKVAMSAVRRKFSPEFVNRIDHVITYQPLDPQSFAAIVDHEVERLQRHIVTRLATRAFSVEVPFSVRQWLVDKGTSVEYGARELKRTIHRHLAQPLAAMVTRGQVAPGSCVAVKLGADRDSLELVLAKPFVIRESVLPTVLVVDGNSELLYFLERLMLDEGWEVAVAGTAAEARKLALKRKPHAVLTAGELPDGRGVELAVQLCGSVPGLRGIVMTGVALPEEEERVRLENRIVLLGKPFLVRQVLGAMQSRPPFRAVLRPDAPTKAA
jgi:ATP-dependent Clp protease ATP-binding subunit ClpA/ActR/RegA family two-component response regulator